MLRVAKTIALNTALAGALFGPITACNFFFAYAPDQLCETQVRAICRFAFNCCSGVEREQFGLATNLASARSEAECVEELLETNGACREGLAVQNSVNEGRFQYDTALAERCNKEAIDAANSCNADILLGDDATDPDEECTLLNGNAFAYGEGQVDEGDECFADYECAAPGAVCDLPEPDDDIDLEDLDNEDVVISIAGECRFPAEEGEDCSEDGSDGLCEPGTFCNVDLECEEFEDIELLENGDECLNDNECESGFCDLIDADTFESECNDPPAVVVEVCNGGRTDDGAASDG